MVPTRRALLTGTFASVLFGTGARGGSASGRRDEAVSRIESIESKATGRLGVCVLEAGAGRRLGYRADERFPMCSTFKLLVGGAVLKRIDEGRESLSRRIPLGPADLLDYAPVTKAHVAEGSMTVSDLCAAAIEWSDNSAANLLLSTVGGPPGLTAFTQGLGDAVTRLDRTEPTLNTAIPGDPRDTSSPAAMARDAEALLLGSALLVDSRRQLEAWLVACQTGGKRLRAGLPATWRIGDKTGTGDNGTANTVAILRPPQGAPLLAVVYLTGCQASPTERDAVHADVARIIAEFV